MRILLVSNLFPPEFIGGYELIAAALARRLAAEGHEVLVATSPLINHGEELPDEGFRIERCLSYVGLGYEKIDPERRLIRGTFIDLGNIAAMERLISTFAPDRVLLGNVAGLGAYGMVVLTHSLGYTPVLYMADNVFDGATLDTGAHEEFRRMFATSEILADLRVMAVSTRVLEETRSAVDHPLGKVIYMPGWFSRTPALDPAPGRPDLLRCVFSSRIAPHKGVHVLRDAVCMLRDRGETGFLVDVYGGGQAPEFLQRAHAAGVGGFFRYNGAVSRDQMLRDFSRYDTLLFPTWEREPLGLVPFEAGAQGCIPIMTGGAGASEWLIDGADCLKIERDPASLAGAIQQLMHMPLAEREKMRTTVRQRIRSLFDEDAWFPRIEQFLVAAERRFVPTPRQSRNIQVALFAITRVWKG